MWHHSVDRRLQANASNASNASNATAAAATPAKAVDAWAAERKQTAAEWAKNWN